MEFRLNCVNVRPSHLVRPLVMATGNGPFAIANSSHVLHRHIFLGFHGVAISVAFQCARVTSYT